MLCGLLHCPLQLRFKLHAFLVLDQHPHFFVHIPSLQAHPEAFVLHASGFPLCITGAKRLVKLATACSVDLPLFLVDITTDAILHA